MPDNDYIIVTSKECLFCGSRDLQGMEFNGDPELTFVHCNACDAEAKLTLWNALFEKLKNSPR